MHDTALPHLLQHCQTLSMHALQPRQRMDAERWDEAWADTLAGLHEFTSHGYYGIDIQDLPTIHQAQAQADWHHAALLAQQLVRLAYSGGLPTEEMDPLLGHVLHLWQEYGAHWRSANEGRHTNKGAPLNTAVAENYPAAVELLALPVLLDRQELIPGVVERLFNNRCDCLLDYLSAAACDKTEASEQVFRPAPYAGLNAFFEQRNITAEPLAPYLQTAYPVSWGLKDSATGIADVDPLSHRWAWEVAALVVLYGLDDQALQQHPSYPHDLVLLAKRRLAASYPRSLRA